MSPHETRIIQLAGAGSGGGGPYTVSPDTPAIGITRVTDSGSGNSFDLPSALADTIFNADGSLTGARVITLGSNNLTFDGTGGGEFIIDGKLTVTGLIDPTGLEYTRVAANPGNSSADTTWIDVADGRLKVGAEVLLIQADLDGQTLDGHADVDLTTVAPLAGQTIVWNGTHFVPGASTGDNIYTADGVLTGPRTIDGATSFPGIGSSFAFENLGSLQVDTISGTGGTGYLRLDNNDAQFRWANGTEAGGFESNEATQETRMFHSSSSGASAISAVSARADGVELLIPAAGDLAINGDPGVAGQVVTSAGPDLPPTWGSAGGANMYTTDGTLTSDRYVSIPDGMEWTVQHTGDGSGQIWLSVSDSAGINASISIQEAERGPLLYAANATADRRIVMVNDPDGEKAWFYSDNSLTAATIVKFGFIDGAGGNPAPVIQTQSVADGSATNGQVLTLIDAGTGEADFADPSGAKYDQAFVAADWVVGGGGDATLTVAQATHGYTPAEAFSIAVYEQTAGAFSETSVDTVHISAAGDLTLTIPASDVFDGQLILS